MILFLSYIYFILPKVDLVQFSFSPTGIRIQDLVIVLMTLLLPLNIKIKIFKTICILTIFAIPGIVVGLQYLEVSQILFGYLRLLEYLCLSFGLLYLFNRNKIHKLVLNCLLIHLFIGFFQYLQLIPLIDPGRGVFYSKQFAGLMGNPAELTYFFIAILPILMQRKSQVTLPIKLLILLNGVKAGIMGLIVTNNKKMILILGLIFIFIDHFTMGLLLEVYNFVNYQIKLDFQNISINEIKRDGLDEYDGERSLAQRVYKWWNIVGFLFHNEMALFFGVGYGSIPGATDGGLIKMLLELGILNFLIILTLFLNAGAVVFLVFFICNFMFDGYTSSVVAPILFLYVILQKNLFVNQKS